MLLEAWKEFEVFHLCPMPLCHLLPLSRASHVRARLKRVSNLLFRAPIMLPPTQGYRSFRYNFIQSTCKLFHVLCLRNEEYSPKTFSCSHASYTWSGRNFCAVSLLEFVSKRPQHWDAAILSRWDTGSFIFSQMLSCCFRLNTETTHHKNELRRRCLGE